MGLVSLLRLLDAEAAGVVDADDFASIGTDWGRLLEQAHRLRDGGYRALAQLPG